MMGLAGHALEPYEARCALCRVPFQHWTAAEKCAGEGAAVVFSRKGVRPPIGTRTLMRGLRDVFDAFMHDVIEIEMQTYHTLFDPKTGRLVNQREDVPGRRFVFPVQLRP